MTFSANKIKELLTDEEKSNFNTFLIYKLKNNVVGYCIAYENKNILHYSYPFYDRATDTSNLGLGMMLRAILHAQESGKKYIYLGSAQRPTDTYKLQFNGLEWFDGETWQTETEGLKSILTNETSNDTETNLARHSREGENPEKNKKLFNKFVLFLTSLISAFILVYLTFTISEQIANRNVMGKGVSGSWACFTWFNHYPCTFSEFVNKEIQDLPLILVIHGIISIPVSVIIYLVLTHRERIQKK